MCRPGFVKLIGVESLETKGLPKFQVCCMRRARTQSKFFPKVFFRLFSHASTTASWSGARRSAIAPDQGRIRSSRRARRVRIDRSYTPLCALPCVYSRLTMTLVGP